MREDTARGWTFLTNHGHVLLCIALDPAARVRDIAEQVGITERASHRIVTDLIEAGYLSVTKVGRRNTYKVDADRNLRHPLLEHLRVRDFLALLARSDDPLATS